jgi:hypothetical protein
MMFARYIGIDYSGGDTPDSRQAGIQVYESFAGGLPTCITSPTPKAVNWSRAELAEWLDGIFSQNTPTLIGIDHAYGFPKCYLDANGLASWDAFLEDFVSRYDTRTHPVSYYLGNVGQRKTLPGLPDMVAPTALRLTEQWSGTAWSVFDFRPRGVAHSTFAGIPWLQYLRHRLGERIHWWPFDGWEIPQGKSVMVEAYATVCRVRCTVPPHLADHKRDAYAIAAWMQERDQLGLLQHYFTPPLSPDEGQLGSLEGWILGVM